MKKLVLVFVLFIVFYNMTFGQEPQQPIQTQVIPATQDIVSRMDSISSGDLKETLVENSQDQNKNRKTYTGNEGGTQALFGISIFGRSKNDKDAGTKASRMDLSYEGGVIGKTVPLFGTIGH